MVSPVLKTFSSLLSASPFSSSPAAPARKKLLQGPQQWLLRALKHHFKCMRLGGICQALLTGIGEQAQISHEAAHRDTR